MTQIRVWGPALQQLQVSVAGRTTALTRDDDGYWTGAELAPGTEYLLLLDDDPVGLPDPATRQQSRGVNGATRVYDQSAFPWHDDDWRGRDLRDEAIVYEMHVGTFTPDATFDGAIERLEHLVELGVTHVEVLPVNDFDGVWNWGYDGVDWYAVHETYGGPDGLKRFVDACHARGLAVVLDVVYNHLGPAGNYLPRFGPFLKSGRNTWGDLVNVEEPGVRRFVIDNALMWLRDFHVDALRLDAVHALQDSSPTHILAQLSSEVDALSVELGRPLTLIAESDLNDQIMITSRDTGGYGIAAQWDDDVHHALHALLTGERQGYYVDFGSLAVLAKTFTHAFLHDGTYSTFREAVHGKPVDRDVVSGWQFVVCLQDHDQIGNRAVGDRLPEITSPGKLAIGAVLLLTSPFTPMLFMGEEWAASTRWPFFCSHPDPELAAATSKGRLEEFAGHGWAADEMIDPQDPRAYRESVLDWSELTDGPHATMFSLYRALIRLRASEPELRDHDLRRVAVAFDEQAQTLAITRGSFRVVANLAEAAQPVALDATGTTAEIVLATGPADLDGDGAAVSLGPETAAIVRLTPA